jgi:hypothetical protein
MNKNDLALDSHKNDLAPTIFTEQK